MMPPKLVAWRLLLGRAGYMITPPARGGPHFVREYRRLVRRLKADYPRDTAMSLAVGGAYQVMGEKQADLVQGMAAIEPNERLLDLGCGSGRLASAISRRIEINYTGIDILNELLAYAKAQSPDHYQFIRSRTFKLPMPDRRFDVVCAFSLFTHLKHEETYVYLSEAWRVLRPEGRLIFSFWEFAEPSHWFVFDETLDALLRKKKGITNVYTERTVIRAWATRLGFADPEFAGPGDPGPGGAIGQSIALLRRPD